jgi:hypothetical protein
MKHPSKLVGKSIIATAVLSSALMNPITAYSTKLSPDTVKVKEPVASKPTPVAQTIGIPHTGPVIMSPAPSSASSSNEPPRKQLALPAPSNAAPVAPLAK